MEHNRLVHGDTFEHGSYTFRVVFDRDDNMGEPWKEHDGHGVVSDWRWRGDKVHADKRPGERVLIVDRHHSARFYDVQASLKIALRDGWGPACCAVCGEEAGGVGTSMYGSVHKYGPRADHAFKLESKRKTAARAVDRDFEYLRAWCNDEWEWLWVRVVLVDDDGRDDNDYAESVSGIDGDHDNGKYLTETAHELADQIIARLEVKNPAVVLSEN